MAFRNTSGKYIVKQDVPRVLHLSASDDPDKEVATEIIFHILESTDDLFIEVFTHNEVAKATGMPYLQFSIPAPAWFKLTAFLMEERVDGVVYPIV